MFGPLLFWLEMNIVASEREKIIPLWFFFRIFLVILSISADSTIFTSFTDLSKITSCVLLLSA